MVEKRYNYRYYFYSLLLLAACFVAMPVMAATLTATVDRNPVNVDESFQLTLTIAGGSSGEPDLGVLEKDFEILSRSQSSSFQMINGRTSRQTRFIFTLMPKTVGTLEIPPIRVGADSSQGIRMTVRPAKASSQNNSDIWLDVDVDTKDVYVQAQMLVTVRLYRTVSLANASLSEPRITGGDAVIEKLGDDSEYDVQRNGVQTRVVERRYAVFPQHSGRLTLEPVVFKGQIVVGSSGFFSSPLLQNTRSKRLRSKSITVNVRAKPAALGNNAWLPARKVTLTEKWQQNPPTFKVGEAITRTLTLSADGLMAAQLPKIGIDMPAELKHYSDQAVLNNQQTVSGISGSRQQKIAIIPTHAGALELPEIRLEWWNTQTGRSEILRLPSRQIQVLAADNTSPLNNITAAAQGDVDAAQGADKSANLAAVDSDRMTGTERFPNILHAGFWPWLSLGLIFGWLATVLLMRRQASSTDKDVMAGQSELKARGREVLGRLKQACQQNDPVAAKTALLAWAGVYLPEHKIMSLADIARVGSAELAAQIDQLNAVLYSKDHPHWDGQALWSLIAPVHRHKPGNSKNDKRMLAELYPDISK